MPDQPYTIDQFIDRHGITSTAVPTTSNPHASGFGPEAVHFLVTLRCLSPGGASRRMSIPFSGGSPRAFPEGLPTTSTVLGCLWSDASSADEDFEDWADSIGADSDSRKAYALWETVREQTAELARFLGDAVYADLLTVDED